MREDKATQSVVFVAVGTNWRIAVVIAGLVLLASCEQPDMSKLRSAPAAVADAANAAEPLTEFLPEAPSAPEADQFADTGSTDVAPAEGAAEEPAPSQIAEPVAEPADAEAARSPVVAEDDPFADARALFENGCQRCHSLEDDASQFAAEGPPPGGPGGGRRGPRGPNLAHVGSQPGRDAAWLADHIRDPKSHNPRSRMPPFADKLTEEEIGQLAEFLASLQ